MHCLCAVAVLALGAATVHAQSFPKRPIRIVVPWLPGGPPDAVARLIGQRIGDAMKQQVVIDNRPGANSIIGTEIAEKSRSKIYAEISHWFSSATSASPRQIRFFNVSEKRGMQ